MSLNVCINQIVPYGDQKPTNECDNINYMKHNLVGNKYGKLKVVDLSHLKGNKVYWLCVCDCGNQKSIYQNSLIGKGKVSSCGCSRIGKFTSLSHGFSKKPIYRTWANMLNRCKNINATGYKNYGGRGIKVSKDWGKFENFLRDMGEAPSGLSLDRIDVNKDYSKDNCRWATSIEQNNNKRKTTDARTLQGNTYQMR